MTDTTMTKQILLTRRSPAYWCVTFMHPPLNIFGPEMLPQLNEIITALETDEHVTVVVMDSAVEGFFLTHYNFVAPLEETTRLPPGPTLATASRHAGAAEPCSRRIDRLHSRACDRRRQRAGARQRYAFRQP